MNKFQIGLGKKLISVLMSMFLFTNMSTESKKFSLLRERGLIDFEKLKIGTILIDKLVGNDVLLVPHDLYAIYVPTRKTLKIIFTNTLNSVTKCRLC